MHSMHFKTFNLFYNGDYSGEVIIKQGGVEVRIPFEDLEEVVADRKRAIMIEKLEEASTEEILYGLDKSG